MEHPGPPRFCPMKFASAENSRDAFYQCVELDCMWYVKRNNGDHQYGECAMMTIAKALKDMRTK